MGYRKVTFRLSPIMIFSATMVVLDSYLAAKHQNMTWYFFLAIAVISAAIIWTHEGKK